MQVVVKPASAFRRGWFAVWAVYLVLAALGAYPYLASSSFIHPLHIGIVLSDLVAIFGLYGYVFRKPIHTRWLGVLYLVVAYVLVLRVMVVIYFVTPVLFPWERSPEHIQAVMILIAVPLPLLAAYALWQYSNEQPG